MIKSNYIPHLPTTHNDMLDTPLIPSMNIDAQLPSVAVLLGYSCKVLMKVAGVFL